MGGWAAVDGEVVVVTVGASVCAGAWVADTGRVLTAAHCVASGGRPRVTLANGEVRRGRVVASSPAVDLAWIEAGAPPGSGLPLGPTPAVGAPVSAVGHPFAASAPGGFLAGTLRYSHSEGIVAAVGPHAIQVTAPINPGNSGGPLLDAEGRLVGVVSRRIGGADGVAFASRLEPARGVLDTGRTPWVTGTFGASVHGTSWEGADGVLSVGGGVELAVRDAVLVRAALSLPIDARWAAAEAGRSRFIAAELAAGPSVRLGHGPLTTRLDAFGGLAWVGGFGRQSGINLNRFGALGPWVGGGARIAGVGVHGGAVWTEGVWSGQLRVSLAWPGTLTVF